MHTLSAFFYLIGAQPFWAWGAFLLAALMLVVPLILLTKNAFWALLVPFALFAGLLNMFTGHFLNALFLNAVGIEGTAYVVHAEMTNSTYNEDYIWDYDVVLKTAEGEDVTTSFSTMTAAIYPIRNEILIPPEGEAFVAKYVPGFERNIVIMSDLSDYGKRWRIRQDLSPVEKAEAQLAVSPDNPAFIAQYRDALETFIEEHREDADPAQIEDMQKRLDGLR